MTTPLLFDIKNLSTEAASMKRLVELFAQHGESLVSHDVGTALKRTAGISYKEVTLTFADSQTVMLSIKQTGDIWKVKVNNKETPLRNQDAHKPEAVVQELVQKVQKGRTAAQKAKAATVTAQEVVNSAKAAGLKNTQKSRVAALQTQVEALDAAIAEAQKQKEALEAEINEKKT